MDLKHQLVIWKKAEYLLKNLTLTPKLCDLLVDYGLFNSEMIAKVQKQKYNVDKTLMALTLLGSHGDQVYEQFLRALTECHFNSVVNELRRTEKNTKFGEVMPPVYNYFLDMSEFLQQNSHISIRLCEADKHVIQSYIDGKITVHNLTMKEKVDKLETECRNLRAAIEHHNMEIMAEKERTEVVLREMETVRGELAESRDQYNRLQESSKAELADLLLYRQLRVEANRVEVIVRKEVQQRKMQPVAATLDRNATLLSRQRTTTDTKIDTNKPTELRRETPGSGDRRQRLKSLSAIARLRWLRARERLLSDKSYSLQSYREQVELTADCLAASSKHSAAFQTRATAMTMGSLVETGMTMEVKALAADVGYELRNLNDQINDIQTSVNKLRDEISIIEAELSEADLRRLDGQPGLDAKVQTMVETLRKTFIEQRAEDEANHVAALGELRLRTDLDRNKMNELNAMLRFRLRAKMHDVHRRDVVLRKLKRELVVISRYHAKNMSAQISADECRKIVRDVIRDARSVMTVIDKWDAELLAEQEKLEEDQDNDKAKENLAVEPIEKPKKKINHVLDNELLRLIADKITEMVAHQQQSTRKQKQTVWRQLGSHLDLTPNRLDLVEIDAASAASALQTAISAGLPPPPPRDRLDFPAYAMLRVWRDEDGGQPGPLRDALIKIGRRDVASIVEALVPGLPTATTSTVGTSAVAAAVEDSGADEGGIAIPVGTNNRSTGIIVQVNRPRLLPTSTLRQTLRAR